MACCRCNRTGRCRNCLCVKNGKPCQGCLPQQLGNCANTVRTQPSQAALTRLSHPPQRSTPESSPGESSPFSYTMSCSSPELLSSPCPSVPNTSVPAETSPCWDAPDKLFELPSFSPAAEPTFTWGSYDSATFIHSLNAIYDEVVHWKLNLFKVPYGKAGKSFVSELARLYKAFATGSALESIAMKAAAVLPILLLQKPSNNSKAKEQSTCLERRLRTWLDGDLDDLLLEGRTLHQRIPKSYPRDNQKRLAQSFAILMFQGENLGCSSPPY